MSIVTDVIWGERKDGFDTGELPELATSEAEKQH